MNMTNTRKVEQTDGRGIPILNPTLNTFCGNIKSDGGIILFLQSVMRPRGLCANEHSVPLACARCYALKPDFLGRRVVPNSQLFQTGRCVSVLKPPVH